MSKLRHYIDEAVLDFALRHVTDYYDTDFYPRIEEFIAISYSWRDVREAILDSTLDQIQSPAPVIIAWPKPTSGFRIVHRLEPIDSIIYTALAKAVAPKVEAARAPRDVACSYRIIEDHSSFFSHGSGFQVYRQRCEQLGASNKYVLSIDIADFYNKIYLHRAQNAIQLALNSDGGTGAISKEIENLLLAMNTKASQGVPVGPAASIVISEAVLIDADQFIHTRGFEHVRYVDDFRVFGESKEQLQALLQDFCVYMHETQRLSLAPIKTKVSESTDFLRRELNNQYQLEKLNILEAIEVVNPYDMEVATNEAEAAPDSGEILVDAITRISRFDTIDLGVIRAIVRRARANSISAIAPPLLDNLEFFAPAVNDIALYLDAVTDANFIAIHLPRLIAIAQSHVMYLQSVRMWFEWYFSRHETLLQARAIRQFVYASKSLRPQAVASITLRNQSWVKAHKSEVLRSSSWDRRSIILAAQILSSDERSKWLQTLTRAPQLDRLDKWLIKWVLDGSPVSVPPKAADPWDDDDIPY
ncbi:RNA-directed DNA polymerase [Thiomonas sp. FB-6]|uniref:RNA-directed DNA polymerase n=1 Tax=Thiomonas sp. FB-6 TaxID=1158291 RepID=UPI0009DB9F0F|nr:RNA-directed DNA polymerase [Thiomonas sp. FB-6]